jgi:MSHA biogenesis protein MshI
MPLPVWLRRKLSVRSPGDRWGVQATASRLLAVQCRWDGDQRPRFLRAVLAEPGALEGRSFSGSTTTLLLPPDDYAIEWVEAPPVPAAELVDALRWSIKDRIDWPLEDVAVSGYEMPPATTSRRLAVAVAAPRDRLRHWLRGCPAEVAGRLAIDVPEQALRNLAVLASGGACVGMLHAGFDAATLVVVRAGALEACRRLPYDHATVADPASPLFEAVVLDLQRTLDAHARQVGDVDFQHLWVSSVGDARASAATLGEHLVARCEPFEPQRWVEWCADLPLHDQSNGTDFLVAAGAALR